MSTSNRMLQRQLRKLGLQDHLGDANSSRTFTREQINSLLEKVAQTYGEFEAHLLRQDLILDVANREYSVIFGKLQDLNAHLNERVQEKTALLLAQQNSVENQKILALGEMAAGIAHEINNPLAIVIGTIEQLLKQAENTTLTPGVLEGKLHRIQESSKRIAKIINGVRIFARDSRSEPAEVCSLEKIVEDSLSFCRERFQSMGIELIVDEIDLDLFVMARPVQISQILLNLLNNALDALHESPAPHRVTLTTVRNQSQILIRVTDSGPGVPVEIEQKIMQPFFTTKEIGKGTGLGLSVSLGLAVEHGGNLRLNREIGPSCFELSLPLLVRS